MQMISQMSAAKYKFFCLYCFNNFPNNLIHFCTLQSNQYISVTSVNLRHFIECK